MLSLSSLTLSPLVALPAMLLLGATSALAGDPVTLILRNNRFILNEVTVPAGERLRIEVKNQDSTPAEFESHDLRESLNKSSSACGFC